jgi:hypothetical protein
MKHIKLTDILELKSPYKELIEAEAIQTMKSTGGMVTPEQLACVVEEQNLRICLQLGCSEPFAKVLGELARCRAADLVIDAGE